MFNKSVKVAAVLAASLFVLSACGSSDAAPTVTVTEEMPTYESTPEQNYLDSLRATGNQFALSSSDADLINVGYQACEVLDSGYTLDELVTELVMSGNYTTTEETEFVGMTIGAAIREFCPHHSWQVGLVVE